VARNGRLFHNLSSAEVKKRIFEYLTEESNKKESAIANNKKITNPEPLTKGNPS